MESEPVVPQTSRHKCSACFKQYKVKEHLIEHMKESCHSVHQPKCGVCKKYCKTLESVREHLTGPLAKSSCGVTFSTFGCAFCLKIIDVPEKHDGCCPMHPPSVPEVISLPNTYMCNDIEMTISNSDVSNDDVNCPKLVAMDCEMVGGGKDGTLSICGRVCLVNENEEVIFHSYVKPVLEITNYRYELTGITEEDMVDAMPVSEVREKVAEILRNGEESTWRMRSDGGKACLLIGHDLEHDLDCLRMDYPENLIRDTAKYRPLLKTNLVSHSLKYLTKTYLGYEIQTAAHNPYEDAVAALRLYKMMRDQEHKTKGVQEHDNNEIIFRTKKNKKSPFDSYKKSELMRKSPDELLEISRSDYKCWCLDAKRATNS